MPSLKEITINLLPKDPFFESFLGRTLKWALSGGRYIVIFTELIVIVSFAARFTLDRQVTDLNSSLFQKEVIIDSYGELENEVRTIQSKIDQYKQLEQQTNITDIFPKLTQLTPPAIELNLLTLSNQKIVISGSTLSQNTFNIFINNLQLSKDLVNVEISNVESLEDSPGIAFTISAESATSQVTAKETKETK